MARLLAVDWDRREVRCVVAAAVGGRVQIREARATPLIEVVGSGDAPQPDLEHSLQAALAGQRIGRAAILVGVDRGRIELLSLTLPPAQDAELPELVFHQAMRESSTIQEDTVLDFFPLDDDPAQPRRVTAAALAPEELQGIRALCGSAGLRPARMLLRPYAAAALLTRLCRDRPRVCLLLGLIGEEVDLTVLVDDRPVFVRTVRLPRSAAEEQVQERVLDETRRTIAVAVQTLPGGEPIEAIYLFGDPDDHPALADRIRAELLVPVEVVDPFAAVDATGVEVPEDRGRFAPLLGMVVEEARGGRHAVDFLHPRRRDRPTSRRQMIAMGCAAAALLVVVFGYLIWRQFAEIDGTIGQLSQDYAELNGVIKAAADQQRTVTAVRQWLAGDVLWLEELRELSLRLPPEQDAVVLRMSLSAGRSGGGAIDLEGLVSDPTMVARLEHNLRDQYHAVRSQRIEKIGDEADYTWHFNASILVARRDKSQYLKHRPAAPP